MSLIITPSAPASSKYLLQTADTTLSNAQVMGSLGTGLVKNTTTTGVQFISKVAVTEPATSAVLTIQDGFTLTASGNATVSGTNTGDNAANSSTMYIGTTQVALNRASAALVLTGITSIDGNAATVTTNANLTGPITSTGNATAITDANVTSRKVQLQYSTATLSAGNFDQITSAGTWYDVTSLTMTFTPATASVCLITFYGSIWSDNATNGRIDLRIVSDGVAIGTFLSIQATSAVRVPISFSAMTTLTAASHTIKVQMSDQGGSNQAIHLSGSSTYNQLAAVYWSQ